MWEITFQSNLTAWCNQILCNCALNALTQSFHIFSTFAVVDPTHTHTHTHTHIDLLALFLGLPRWAGTRKVKPIWILLKQELVSDIGISWAICKSASHSRQKTTPAPHPSFLHAGCPSCRPTNSVKTLKALSKILNSSRKTLENWSLNYKASI